jgi:mycothiol synthase
MTIVNPAPEPQLVMRRARLDGLPERALPDGYSCRSFLPGDEAAWESIIGASFGWPDSAGKFDAIMRRDPAFRPKRVLFLCHGDLPVATASAWHRDGYGPHTGYLHYVGVRPERQGVRLGLHVSVACLRVMAGGGRSAAVLQTDDFRLPAIKTYLRLGFVPLLVHENQRRRWRDVRAAIDPKHWNDACEAALVEPSPIRLH